MTGTSETQASTEQLAPVVLPADALLPDAGNEVFCKDTKPGCNQSYHDIIYVTGQRRFWLLPKRTADHLAEAAATLKQKTVDTDKAARMSKIADSGLLDYFLTPSPDAFLEFSDGATDERTRYLDAEAAVEDEKTLQEQYRQEWHEARARGDSTAAMEAERKIFYSNERVAVNERVIVQLEEVAYQRAESLGYLRENGVFYTPRALQARDAVDTYIAERDNAIAHGFEMFDQGNRKVGTAWEHLRDYKALHQKFVETGEVNARALRGVRLNILALEGLMAKYIGAIVELAECGIAVPEFALSPDDLYQGTEEFQAYVKLLGQRLKLEQSIEQRYAEWTSATGNNAAPPGVLFVELQAQWHQLNDEAERIKAIAEARVRELIPPRLFLWEPESYRPKPIERLAKANFPFRELSSAASGKELSHISLQDLAKQKASGIPEILKEMKALPKSLAKQADEDRAFSDWLKLEGAHPIKEKGPWFDEDGLFLPDEFFAVLKSKGLEVESLKTEDKRQRWGATLKAMIFEDRQLRNLMLFDNSPQAQLVRCLLPAGSNMQTELKVEGPQWQKGPQAFQAKAHLDVAAWRGEVSLFQFELPDRSKAKPIAPSYKAYDGSTRTFDFGKLSLCLSAKAWGFAGASLLLARDLTLDQKTGFTSIAGYDSATKTGDLAKFDLFIGAQAGCKLTGQLDWCPPPSTLPPAPVPNRIPINGWRTLAKLDMELVAAVGGGVSGKVRLQLNKGRFLLSIQGSLVWGVGFKGYMTFEVGYESVVALLELIRKELLANNNEDPAWIDGEAMAYVRMLSLFGALAMDVPFIYARRYAFAKELYDKLTDGGRGAGIANTLVMDKNQEVMRNWVINLQPNAFGPLLMALSSAPGFLSDKEHLLQQQAIERCLGWIEPQPDAAQRFEDAVIRMNRDGARPPNAGQAYCENRLRLDSFMSEKVSGLVGANNQMRARYLQRVERLGGRLFGYCEYRTEPFGPALGGAETIKISYKGPTID